MNYEELKQDVADWEEQLEEAKREIVNAYSWATTCQKHLNDAKAQLYNQRFTLKVEGESVEVPVAINGKPVCL